MSKQVSSFLLVLFVSLFVLTVPILLFVDKSTAWVWTIALPLLPLFIVIIGYSNWRNICPLAYFSKISQKLTWIQKRKVPVWFEDNFYFFQFLLLFTAFSLRLIILNFDNQLLAAFVVFVIASAFLVNLFFTGKSWCNFFCPVGVVEKIYCGSNAHNYNTNSACESCSACKKNCPDIDMESNYWKESVNKQKSFVFYSFSGLVLGFYLYFYLQSGSFDSYYTGAWTYQHYSLLSSGFFFAPYIPMVIAVPLSLGLFSIVSFFLFKTIETYLWKKRVFKGATYSTVVHRVRVVSGFVAFNVFYIFAGAPTYLNYPEMYAIFYFVVVSVSAILLHKEIFREESYFVQERFALKILKKMNLKGNISQNLKEIYYTYVNSNKNTTDKFLTYKETLLDLLEDGILTKDSMVILDKLRKHMGISEADHLKALRIIKLKDSYLFDENIEKSSEGRYQRESYKQVLLDALENHKELSASMIESLRKQFCITEAMHYEIMDRLLNTNTALHDDIFELLKKMNSRRRLHKSIINDSSKETKFLKYVIRNDFDGIKKDLFSLMYVVYKDYKKELDLLKNCFKYQNIGTEIKLEREMLDFMDENIANAMYELKKDFENVKSIETFYDNKLIIKHILGVDSINIASAALLSLKKYPKEFYEDIDMERFLNSSDENIVALVQKVTTGSGSLTHYEAMMYMHNITLFENIKYTELSLLVSTMEYIHYEKDEYIIKQGALGDTLYIISSGVVGADIDGKIVNEMSEADYFGEVALLGDITRIASVKTLSEVDVLTLSKSAFKFFIKNNPQISIKLMKEIIRKLTNGKISNLDRKTKEELLLSN